MDETDSLEDALRQIQREDVAHFLYLDADGIVWFVTVTSDLYWENELIN